MTTTLDAAVARFGRDVRDKLNDPSAVGEPEDQLRGPLQNLIADINALIGKQAEHVNAVGEVRLPDLMTRPDFAVTRKGLIGFIEVKAPGKGSDPTAFPAKSADRVQRARRPRWCVEAKLLATSRLAAPFAGTSSPGAAAFLAASI